jgi:4'-phosphopantetheinyl transferase
MLTGEILVRCWITENLGQQDIAKAEALLSTEEKRRSTTFRRWEDRRDYSVAHALLRRSIAVALGCDPTSLEFEKDKFGKPRLRDPSSNLGFNITHTRGLAACGLALGHEIGIDAEAVKPGFECEQVLEQAFTAEEIACLRTCPKTDVGMAVLKGHDFSRAD